MHASQWLGVTVGDRGFDDVIIDVQVSQPYSPNSPPTITPIPDERISEHQTFQYQVTADDPDPGDSLEYTLQAPPPGMSINPDTGMIAWTPDETQGGNSFGVNVVVEDLAGETASTSFTITVEEVNEPPVLEPIGNQQITEENELSVEFSASDADIPANTLTYSLVGGPSNANVDPNTGEFTWTPSELQGPRRLSVHSPRF